MTKYEYMAACPYCGQTRAFEAQVPNLTQEEQIDYVAMHCICDEAEKRRWYRRTQDAIVNVLGEESPKKGFDYECDEDVIDLVRVLVRSIIDGHMNNVTFVEPNGDTIKLNKGSDRVKIGRISKRQVVM